jgi:pentatricopeptide repeat protein
MINNLFAKKSQATMLAYLRSKANTDFYEHFVDRTKATSLAEALVHTRSPQRANQVLLLAHLLGCPLKQNTYESVVYQLAETGHWHLIPRLVALGKRQTGRTTVRLLNWQMRAFIESEHYKRLVNTLDDFSRENLTPNRRTYHLLISGHLRNHNVGMARACLKMMEDAGIVADATTHATVISVYRSLGPAVEVVDHAFDALRDVSDRVSIVMLNNLMLLYMDSNDESGILRVLTNFHQGNVDITLSDEVGKHLFPPGRKMLFPVTLEAPDIGVPVMPDVVTFTLLINYMTALHNLPGALCLFERMLTYGIKPDAAAAAALLRSYFVAGQEDIAVCIVADMCRQHQVSRVHFQLLGLTSTRADTFCPHFKSIPPTAEVFNALMKNTLNTRGLKGMRVVLRIMRLCRVIPDTKTLEIFMNYLDGIARARPRVLIRVLRSLTSAALRPTLSHIHIIMRSILRREKFLLLGSGWDSIAAKFSPTRRDLSCYPEGHISGIADSFDPTAGIELPRKLSYRALMRPVIQSLSSRSIMSNRATIALRLKREAITKSGLNTAKHIFHEMLARGMHPTHHHFCALMEGHALLGDMRNAENVMTSALDAGIRANVIMFTILISGYARSGRPVEALRTFHAMIAAGIRPDVAAVDATASAYFVVGAYKVARRVLLLLWPYVRGLPEGTEGATLKQLARAFRTRHASRDPDDNPKRLDKGEQMMLRWKIINLIIAWKNIDLVNGRKTRNRRL